MKHSISIILPNYNGVDLLKKNLPSLFEAIEGFEHEIIVVDDCSSDDSVTFLNGTYPDIEVIQNEVNLGFSSTCNKGIYSATKDLLCIVNTDITFTPEYFTYIAPKFKNPKLFAVKGNIINYRLTIDNAFNIDRTTLMYFKRGLLRFKESKSVTNSISMSGDDSRFISLGCCFVCDRNLMLELNGYNEIYSPFYWEDADLARRAMQHGYELLYLPEATVYHQASSTIGNHRTNIRRRLVSIRNKFLFSWYHLNQQQLFLYHIPVTTMNILLRWIILDWKFYLALLWAILRKFTNKK